MAGYADALASVLYPNSASNSLYTLGGQALGKIQQPTYEQPWQNLLASGLQSALSVGLQGYGQYSANQANAENAAAMIPQMSKMGIETSPELQAGLTSENPQSRQLALALLDGQMAAKQTQQSNQMELDKFRQQQQIQFENQKALKQMEMDQQAAREAQDRAAKSAKEAKDDAQTKLSNTQALRTSLNSLKETQDFKVASQTFDAMEKAAGMDTEAANLFFKKAFERVSNPGSVVSPTEAAALDNVQSFYDKNKGEIDAFFGGGKLSEPTRQQMLTIARNYRNGIADTYQEAAQPYLKDATDAKIPHDRILTVPFLSEKKRDPLAFAAKQKGEVAKIAPAAKNTGDNIWQQATAPALPQGLEPLPFGYKYQMTPNGPIIIELGK